MNDHPPTAAPDEARTLGVPARTRLLAVTVLGTLAGVAAAFGLPWLAALLTGWDVTAVSWVTLTWMEVLRYGSTQTSRHATRNDPGRAASDLILLSASAASLVAIGVVTAKAGAANGADQTVLVVLSITSVFIAWSVVHTLFTLRYAALYYTGEDGGIDFNDDAKPTYADFAYLAFTIGMTFQVSDTDITDGAIRHTALRHALLSYVFGAVILASTINLVAGLVH